MVAALHVTGRLPGASPGTTAALVGVLVLDAVAALAARALASAAVSDPSQATLALPMLCFPAVLFGGAVLPVQAMATAGQAHQRGDPRPVGVRIARADPRPADAVRRTGPAPPS